MKLLDILSPKITPVEYAEMNATLNVKHKRITPDVQRDINLLAQNYADKVQGIRTQIDAFQAQYEEAEKRLKEAKTPAQKKAIQKELDAIKKQALIRLPDLTCLLLEFLVIDLDITGESGPLEPTYTNLLTLPRSLLVSMESTIMGTITPEKKSSENLSISTQQAASAASGQTG